MGKLIDIDIMRGESHVSASVQAGDSTVQIRAVNLPEEWLKDSTYVYALISQGENQVLNLMQNATENSKTVKKCGVQSVFTADNKAFKIVIFGTNVEVADGTVNGSYRYVSAPVMVSVGEGIESLTAEILPDKNSYDAISSLLESLQSAVEAEKVRVANEGEREEAEEARADVEEIRASAEIERAEAEVERAKAESLRIESESIRGYNEALRDGNEEQRLQNEAARIEEEAERKSSENAREKAETARETAELGRSAMIESRYFATAEEYEEFIDNIENRTTKIFKLSWGGTESEPFVNKWLITNWTDTSDGNNSRTQVLISGDNIYTRSYIVWEYDNAGGNTQVNKWSEWQIIVDNSRLESRLQRFADEFTIDVDQVYNSKSENAQSGKAVAEAIAQIVNGSPEALDTLYELAKALGNDENFSATVTNEIAGKASLEEFNEFKEICPTKEMLENGDLIVGVAEHALKDVLGVVIHEHYATKEEIPPIINLGDKQDESFLDSLFEKGIYIYTLVSASQATAKTVPKMCIVEDLFATKAGEIRAVYQTLISDLKTRTFSNSQWNKWKILTSISDYVDGYVDAKIGDVETSIENIILKYGLGGDGA